MTQHSGDKRPTTSTVPEVDHVGCARSAQRAHVGSHEPVQELGDRNGAWSWATQRASPRPRRLRAGDGAFVRVAPIDGADGAGTGSMLTGRSRQQRLPAHPDEVVTRQDRSTQAQIFTGGLIARAYAETARWITAVRTQVGPSSGESPAELQRRRPSPAGYATRRTQRRGLTVPL